MTRRLAVGIAVSALIAFSGLSRPAHAEMSDTIDLDPYGPEVIPSAQSAALPGGAVAISGTHAASAHHRRG